MKSIDDGRDKEKTLLMLNNFKAKTKDEKNMKQNRNKLIKLLLCKA